MNFKNKPLKKDQNVIEQLYSFIKKDIRETLTSFKFATNQKLPENDTIERKWSNILVIIIISPASVSISQRKTVNI